MIEVNNLTYEYKSGKGIYDITFKVLDSSVTGYLGPNGAGKSTTIRNLMGFLKANSGNCKISGLDCFNNSSIIKENLGYIPGEIAFLDNMQCEDYIKYQSKLRKLKDDKHLKNLIERFELDTKGSIKKFSKGMKQKLGIITAFMHDPSILILDEPTSGLDPLMQNEFIDLVLEEKKRGKTILLSSHIFEEVEKICDEVIIIKEGRLVTNCDINTLKATQRKLYIVKTSQGVKLKSLGYEIVNESDNNFHIYVKGGEVNKFIKDIASIDVEDLHSQNQNLEEVFLNFYKK